MKKNKISTKIKLIGFLFIVLMISIITTTIYLNDKNKIITEIYQGDKLIQKDEPKTSLVPELLEKLIFPTMINGEKMDMSLVI